MFSSSYKYTQYIILKGAQVTRAKYTENSQNIYVAITITYKDMLKGENKT